MTLTIYGRASSSNVQPVMWCVDELGLVHKRVDAGSDFGVLDTPEFAAMNPNRLIPVLRDRGLVVWESRTILRYLAAEYGSGPFWPASARRRARVDQWLEWAKTTVDEKIISGVFWGFWRTPEAARDDAQIARDWADVNAAMALADRQLDGQAFLCGDAFTLADVGFGTFLYRYFTLPLERPALGNLARYYEALCARPAYQRHVMIDYAELWEKLD
ncbi:glutathione S-transferase [Rhodobacteraceae bacterium NNCM2]|nr:glutathione S-transferase [Coraliihabitans acroporae]